MSDHKDYFSAYVQRKFFLERNSVNKGLKWLGRLTRYRVVMRAGWKFQGPGELSCAKHYCGFGSQRKKTRFFIQPNIINDRSNF